MLGPVATSSRRLIISRCLHDLLPLAYTVVLNWVQHRNIRQQRGTLYNSRSGAIKLRLPQAGAAASKETTAPLTVTIDAEGRYFVGPNEVLQRDPDSLRAAIARVAGPGRDMSVVLSADARTPHQSVVTALEALGGLGFERISIATTPAKQP